MKVFIVAGARPNFMKIAPLFRAVKNFSNIDCLLVHTGQHYDYEMSQTFFDDLALPAPDFFLEAGSGSHAVQTAKIMIAFEELCIKNRPDMIVVVGDVNSTLACSVVAKKMMVKVAHVEAGLRSFDMAMPEEINRLVTDVLSDYFFVTEQSAINNLEKEGKPKERIHFVGNVMVDNLLFQLEALKSAVPVDSECADLKKRCGNYGFLTLHRPSNVDDKLVFTGISEALNKISESLPLIFPVHPRTKKMIAKHGIRFSEHIHMLDPLGFKQALYLWKDAKIVLTDSGGLQEETTALGIPCMTLRENTERPITIELGTNVLAGTTKSSILETYQEVSTNNALTDKSPPFWDGKAAERIWSVILQNENGGGV